jgi:hypothetical protein
MTQHLGPENAEKACNIHEIGEFEKGYGKDSARDQYNNAIGIQLGISPGNCYYKCLSAKSGGLLSSP